MVLEAESVTVQFSPENNKLKQHAKHELWIEIISKTEKNTSNHNQRYAAESLRCNTLSDDL